MPGHSNYQININGSAAIFANVFLCTLPSLVITFAPMIVGALVTSLGFSEQQGGFVATADMAGYMTGTISSFLFIHRCHWRLMTLAALLLMVAANTLSGIIDTYSALLFVRFFSGLGGGVIAAIAFASIAQMKDPDSAYGLWLVFQSAIGAVGMFSFPYIIEEWGVGGAFLILAMLLLMGCALLQFVPEQALDVGRQKIKIGKNSINTIAVGVVAILVIYTGLMSVWAYMERIADAAGLTPREVGVCLSISSVGGLMGGTAAAKLSTRFGRIGPAVLSMIGLCASFLLLINEHIGFYIYMLAAVLFFGLWSFLVPYLVGSLAAIDQSGRALSMGNAAIGGGVCLGPALGAYIIGGYSYTVLIFIGMTVSVAGSLIMLPLLRLSQNSPSSLQAEPS